MKYLRNVKQKGEALELLGSLEDNQASLIFLDPQYEPSKKAALSLVKTYPQTDYQIVHIVKEIQRVLKPSAFCLLWIDKTMIGTERVLNWLLRAPNLKIVDFLVWYKKNTCGLGSWLRSKAEFAFLLQKRPISKRAGEHFLNRAMGNVWEENQLPKSQRKHPHQKPRELIKALIEATTQEEDLVVDPCAGSFVVLDACQQTNREFIGTDLTLNDLAEYKEKLKNQAIFKN